MLHTNLGAYIFGAAFIIIGIFFFIHGRSSSSTVEDGEGDVNYAQRVSGIMIIGFGLLCALFGGWLFGPGR